MKFATIQQLRKRAEKDINRAMREAESDNMLKAAKLFQRAGGTLITLSNQMERKINGNKTETH